MISLWLTPWDGMDSNTHGWILIRIQPRNSLERLILEDSRHRPKGGG
jgi:hypothetical protein